MNLNNQNLTWPTLLHLEDGDGTCVVELRAVSVESAHRLRLHVVLVRQVGDRVEQVVRRQERVGDLQGTIQNLLGLAVVVITYFPNRESSYNKLSSRSPLP